jgi:4-amino-4-deoxy-L-arabinose transferase-like glycosyltransferase
MSAGSRPRTSLLILAAILLVAGVLRFAALSTLPPAHYRDVAATALDALRAASGHPRLHYVYDEGLYANLMGLVFLFAGAGDASVRFLGALCGVLTCAGVLVLGRALGAGRAGLYGAFLLGVSFWHLVLSRSGFRAVLLPLLLSFAVALLVDGLRRAAKGRLAVSGLLFGLCAHTYPSSRVVPLLILIVLIAELGVEPGRWRRAGPGILIAALLAALVAGPMLLHYVHHPEDFNNPERIVSIFSQRLPPGSAELYLKSNLSATLLMFHLKGDENWRHNLPGAPLLDPLTGALFLVGLLAAVLMLRGGFERLVSRPRASAVVLLAWVAILLLPNLLSVEGVPHGLRSCGVLPAVMLLSGFGVAIVEELLAARIGRRGLLVAGLLIAALMALWTGYRYVAVWGRDPRVVEEHDGAYRAAARALLAAPEGAARYLIANGRGFDVYGWPAEVQPYLFEMRSSPPVLLGHKDAGQLVLEGRPALVGLIRKDDRVLGLLRELNPGAPIRPVTAPGLSDESPVYRIN